MRRAVSAYGPPSGSCTKANRPAPFVISAQARPVAAFLALIVTPSIGAPALSRTLPTIEPSLDWARTAAGAVTKSAAVTQRRSSRVVGMAVRLKGDVPA